MPIQIKTPGVYINESSAFPSESITPAATGITAFLGRAFSLPNAPAPTQPTPVSSFTQFQTLFGGLSASLPLTYAVRDFFNNGGTQAVIVNLSPAAGSTTLTAADLIGNQVTGTGLYQLEGVGLFNILCIPPDTFTTDIDPSVWNAATTYCQQRRAMLIVDPPGAWTAALKAGNLAAIATAALNLPPTAADNVAVYLPRIIAPDPLNNNASTAYAPCGAVAGVWAATDASVGVWKAPANRSLTGVIAPEVILSDPQQATLNPLGINCLRQFPGKGTLVWGARTLNSTNATSSFQYISVRRLANFIETSIVEGIKWATFEQNAEPLWEQLRLSIGNFLQTLFRQGALAGSTPATAYMVRCGLGETMTAVDIANGVVNISIGFAPLQPGEFVILTLQQTVAG